MKIALLSYIKSCNYGTLLQDYALAQKISDLGGECEYIDYSPVIRSKGIRRILGTIKHSLFHVFTKKPKSGIDDFSFWGTPFFRGVNKKCKEFTQRFIPISEEYNPQTLPASNSKYGKFIVGSDQTWSPHILKERSPFLLKFVTDNGKKYSYAPSLGTLNIPQEFLTLLKESISDFSVVTCRERSNCPILQKSFGRDVFHVVDPTLLLTKDEWMSVALPVSNMPSKYILCYILGEKDCIAEYAEALGTQEKMPVYYIMTRPYYLKKKNLLKNIGPREFVSLLAKASCVVTDSFHGSILSINFKVPFYSFTKRAVGPNSQDNDRIKEVLEEFDLLDRYCEDSREPNGINEFDYEPVYELLQTARTYSTDILKDTLK